MQISRIALLPFLLLLGFVLASCSVTPSEFSTGKTGAAESSGATGETQISQSEDCPVTTPTLATPPDSEYRDPLPHGDFFVSADKKLWVDATEWRQGRTKYPWVKPFGSALVVQGRRLDADAPPPWVEIAPDYSRDFQPSFITIPTAGCWEMEARAGTSVLRFVIFIPPGPELVQDIDCGRLDDVVNPDRVIFVGHIENRSLATSGRFAWLSVRVVDNLYPYSLNGSAVSEGRGLVVLQDAKREPLLAQGEDYLLVLRGVPWQIVCPLQTVVGVDISQEPALIVPSADQPLWSGKTVAEIEAEIRESQQ